MILKLYGHIPEKFGLGHTIPKGVAEDWRKWSLKSGYLFSDEDLDLSGYEKFRGKIRAVGFNDDVAFSPPVCTLDLLKYFPNAESHCKFYGPRELELTSVGHFSFFKKKNGSRYFIF